MRIVNSLNLIGQPLRGVIFDMDGVTINSMKHTYNWQKNIYEKLGNKNKEFLSYSDDWMNNFNKIYASHGLKGIYDSISHVDWNENESEIWELYEDYNSNNPVEMIKKDGVDMKDVISEVYLRGNASQKRMTRLRLGINTTKSRKSLEPILVESKIDGCFDSIVTYDDVVKFLVDGKVKQENIKTDNIDVLRKLIPSNMKEYIEKPNSLSSMLAVNSMGIHPSELIVFEDTFNGVLAYKPISMAPRPISAYVVGVTWGFVKDGQKLIGAGADAIIDSPREIIPLMENLGAFI